MKIMGYIIHESPTTMDIIGAKKLNDYEVKIRAILQNFKVNRNKRLYERDLFIEAYESDPRIKELIRTKSWYGESGHPMEKDLVRQTNVIKENSSHIVLSYDIYDDRIEGDIVNSQYPLGQAFMKEVLVGTRQAFSMRGLGNVVKENGYVKVVKPFKLLCYDNVIYPSHPEAYQIIQEGTRFFNNVMENTELYRLPYDNIIPFTDEDLKQQLMTESTNVMSTLESFGITDLRQVQVSIVESANQIQLSLSDVISEGSKSRVHLMIENNLIKKNIYREYLKEIYNIHNKRK